MELFFWHSYFYEIFTVTPRKVLCLNHEQGILRGIISTPLCAFKRLYMEQNEPLFREGENETEHARKRRKGHI